MNTEKINNIIENKGKFSVDDILTLIDEIDYYEDKIEEQNELIVQNSKDFGVMLDLYT